jgi:hypothetical protein
MQYRISDLRGSHSAWEKNYPHVFHGYPHSLIKTGQYLEIRHYWSPAHYLQPIHNGRYQFIIRRSTNSSYRSTTLRNTSGIRLHQQRCLGIHKLSHSDCGPVLCELKVEHDTTALNFAIEVVQIFKPALSQFV